MMLTLDDAQVVAALTLLIVVIVAGIACYRYFAHQSNRVGREDVDNTRRTKLKHLDFLRDRSQRFGLGLAASLFIAVVAMSWTTYEHEYHYTDSDYELDELMEVIPPRTEFIPPKPTPPPPPQQVEVTEEIPEEPQPDLFTPDIEIDTPIDEEPFIEEPIAKPSPAPILPMPEEQVVEIDPIVNFVQQMPLFGDCDARACSDKELMRFLGKYIKYPALALENDIKGKVIAQFVVEKDGSISNVSILRGLGGGCDEEVTRVIGLMNKKKYWQPGQQNGKPVRVRFRVPVTFTPIR